MSVIYISEQGSYLRLSSGRFVVIKDDEEIREPSEENRKKNEYALAHFQRVNANLQNENDSLRYHFHFITPRNYSTFFAHLREKRMSEFRSDLDMALATEGNGS